MPQKQHGERTSAQLATAGSRTIEAPADRKTRTAGT
jgi:hypothetical protein